LLLAPARGHSGDGSLPGPVFGKKRGKKGSAVFFLYGGGGAIPPPPHVDRGKERYRCTITIKGARGGRKRRPRHVMAGKSQGGGGSRAIAPISTGEGTPLPKREGKASSRLKKRIMRSLVKKSRFLPPGYIKKRKGKGGRSSCSRQQKDDY